jgi:hypothetical protein
MAEQRKFDRWFALFGVAGLFVATVVVVVFACNSTTTWYLLQNDTPLRLSLQVRSVDGSLTTPCEIGPGESCLASTPFFSKETYLTLRANGTDVECFVYVAPSAIPFSRSYRATVTLGPAGERVCSGGSLEPFPFLFHLPL